MLWLKENIGTIIVGLVLLGIVAAIIIRLILRKKAGKCAGCDCCDHCKVPGCALKPSKKEIEDTDTNK